MPQEQRPPYFPFYPADFASDPNVEAMTTEAVGAYILLLCKSWSQEPPGSIPNNDVILARWARLDDDRWDRCKPEVLAAFELRTDERFHQKRLRLEFDKFRQNARKRSQAGKAGADARWQSHANANGNRNANDMRFNGSSSSDSVSERRKKPPDPPAGGDFADLIPRALDSPEFRSAWQEWSQHRRELRKRLTEKSAKRQFKRLEPLGVTQAVSVIEEAVEKGWWSVHPKGEKPKTSPKGQWSNGKYCPG